MGLGRRDNTVPLGIWGLRGEHADDIAKNAEEEESKIRVAEDIDCGKWD